LGNSPTTEPTRAPVVKPKRNKKKQPN